MKQSRTPLPPTFSSGRVLPVTMSHVVLLLALMIAGDTKRHEVHAFRHPAILPSFPTMAVQMSRFPSPKLETIRRFMVMEDFSMFDESNDGLGVDDEDEEFSDQELLEMAGDWDDRIARYNTVHLTGRVGNDPEPRYFDDGKVVVNLSMASRRKYHSLERVAENIKSFEDEETEWYSLEIWGPTAEFVNQYVDKGARIGVIGSLQVDEWADRETGEPQQRAKIIVQDLDILETRAEADARRQKSSGSSPGSSSSSFYGDSRRTPGGGGKRDNDDGYSPAGTGGFFN